MAYLFNSGLFIITIYHIVLKRTSIKMPNVSYKIVNGAGDNISSSVNASEVIVITFTELKKFNPLAKFKYKVISNSLRIYFNKILTSEEKHIVKGDLSNIKSDLIEATNILDIYDDETTSIVLQII